MPVVNQNIGRDTPMGGTVLPDGAVFRTWAPAARDVYVVTDVHATGHWSTWRPDPAQRPAPLGDGTWAGFVPGLADGDPYLFWVHGPENGTEGFKRDPYARELGTQPPFPNYPCLLREAHAYPWHDAGWRAPTFHELCWQREVRSRLRLATWYPNQLKCLIDLCHLNGLAVIFDLVFNHAGGGSDERSRFTTDAREATTITASTSLAPAGLAARSSPIGRVLCAST